jgi:hypothetical protein
MRIVAISTESAEKNVVETGDSGDQLLAPVYGWFTGGRHARSERGEGVAGGVGFLNVAISKVGDAMSEGPGISML